MGEAGGGSEWSLRYMDSGMEVRLCNGKVRGFSFYKSFRGRLYASGLRIGDSLEDMEAVYGEVLKDRKVNDLCDWMLDRVLLIRRGGPQWEGGPVAKLYYYDAGLYVFFDEGYRVSGFGLNKKTDYIEQIDNE